MAAFYWLLSLFFWIYVEIGIVLIAIISYPLALLPKEGRAVNYYLTRYLLKLLFFGCFFRVKVSGRENLSSAGRTIFLANKPDLISTFAVIAYLPRRVRFVADCKMFKQWFLGRLIKAIGCLPDVKEKSEAFGFAASIITALKGQESVLIYPANLRRWDNTIGTFKETELRIAKMVGADIIPLVIKGTDRIIPPGEMLVRPGRIEIVIGPMIEINQDVEIREKLDKLYQNQLGGK